MSGYQLQSQAPVAARPEAPEQEPDDELAPARGLMLGLLLGTCSLGALGALLWWAFA